MGMQHTDVLSGNAGETEAWLLPQRGSKKNTGLERGQRVSTWVLCLPV